MAREILRLDPARPVVVEAESSKIGDLILPPSLWAAMKDAPWIEMAAPIKARTSYLVEAYADILADGDALKEKLAPLRRHRGHALVDDWFDRIGRGDKAGLVESLMQDHYDPAYATAMRGLAPEVIARVDAKSLDQSALGEVAPRSRARSTRWATLSGPDLDSAGARCQMPHLCRREARVSKRFELLRRVFRRDRRQKTSGGLRIEQKRVTGGFRQVGGNFAVLGIKRRPMTCISQGQRALHPRDIGQRQGEPAA